MLGVNNEAHAHELLYSGRKMAETLQTAYSNFFHIPNLFPFYNTWAFDQETVCHQTSHT